MTWHLMHVPPSIELVTSDAPVVSFFREGPGQVLFGGALGLPRVEVSFPLNPSTCLLLHRHEPDVEILANEAFAREMNNRMVRNAERFIISQRQSPQIENAVKKFSYTRRQPKLDKAEILRR